MYNQTFLSQSILHIHSFQFRQLTRAIDAQQEALTKCKEEMDQKKPATVSPNNEKKKKRATSDEITEKAEQKRIKTIIVT